MKKTIRITGLLLAMIVLAGSLVGCGAGEQKQTKTLRFADVGWDSILFHNAVAGTVAETVFGYQWTEVSGSTPITHEAVKKGEIDVHMEVWSDNLPDYNADIEAGALKEVGVNFDDNAQGLYVPRYVIEGDPERGIEPMAPNLKTVADLKDYASLFKDPEDSSKGIIYGGIAGWEITQIIHQKYLYYGLDKTYNYIEPGTDAATSAVLVAAYDRGEPVVAYYWEPTWLLGKYDFVLLEDEPYDPALFLEGKTQCPSVRVTICTSNDFYDSDPEYVAFLSKYHTTSALTSEALAYIEETGADYKTAAKWFLNEHRDMVETWLTAEQADTLYAAIG
ncbi:ABC transporter substrate-binding protein [uncultured Oscillibacter sp.]|uniref:ABC transporter substrate-binding protein n=1 Tax=uncultured Oscillibacter sp. TaxID=876091 RepID=UPI0025DA80EF|nr:ABC transporter substrate-binding protein [uncultured Oscillibacter sp.]